MPSKWWENVHIWVNRPCITFRSQWCFWITVKKNWILEKIKTFIFIFFYFTLIQYCSTLLAYPQCLSNWERPLIVFCSNEASTMTYPVLLSFASRPSTLSFRFLFVCLQFITCFFLFYGEQNSNRTHWMHLSMLFCTCFTHLFFIYCC